MRGERDELPWFKFWARDWLTDQTVFQAPPDVLGAYITLLAHAWLNEGRLPEDEVERQRLARIPIDDGMCECHRCEKQWPRIRDWLFSDDPDAPFQPDPRGGWYCPWLVRQLEELTGKREKRATAGREGGKAKASNARGLLQQTASKGLASPSVSVSGSSSSLSLLPESSPKRARAKQTWLSPFDEAWKARTDGLFEFGPAAKPLKKLIELHGADAVLQAFVAYLDATEPQFLKVARFAATYGCWSGTAPEAKIPPHKNAVEDAFAEYDARRGRLEALK